MGTFSYLLEGASGLNFKRSHQFDVELEPTRRDSPYYSVFWFHG